MERFHGLYTNLLGHHDGYPDPVQGHLETAIGCGVLSANCDGEREITLS